MHHAKQSQLPETGHRGGVSIADFASRIADWGQTCGGTPARRAAGHRPAADCAKQSQTWKGWDIRGTLRQGDLLCKTKPIPGGARWAGARGAWDVGEMCETRRTRQKSGSTEPTCDIGPETRVETQLGDFCRGRQTKPIPGSAGWNEASWVRPNGKCAKQSQTWEGWDSWVNSRQGWANYAKQTQSCPAAGRPGAPEGKVCETKPMFPAGPGGPPSPLGPPASPPPAAIMQNKAKLGQAGASRGRCIWDEPIVRNEPNSRLCREGRGQEGEGRGMSCETKPIPATPGRARPEGRCHEGRSCKTKPISGGQARKEAD
jgi:hypothetical protein